MCGCSVWNNSECHIRLTQCFASIMIRLKKILVQNVNQSVGYVRSTYPLRNKKISWLVAH